jgi:hypothetical protein
MTGEFIIGCTIGTGVGVTAGAGIPTYVNAGYINAGYQIVANQQMPIAALTDFYYQSLDDFVVQDDGLDLTAMSGDKAVNECIVVNGIAIQLPALAAYQGTVAPTYGDPLATMRKLVTQVTLDLKPVAGAEFHTAFFPSITSLSLPMTIDLAATGG